MGAVKGVEAKSNISRVKAYSDTSSFSNVSDVRVISDVSDIPNISGVWEISDGFDAQLAAKTVSALTVPETTYNFSDPISVPSALPAPTFTDAHEGSRPPVLGISSTTDTNSSSTTPGIGVKPFTPGGRALVQHQGATVVIRAAITITIPRNSTVTVGLPASFTSTSERHQLEFRPLHHRVQASAYAPGNKTLELRNLMKKRDIVFKKNEPFLSLSLTLNAAAPLPYLRPLDMAEWWTFSLPPADVSQPLPPVLLRCLTETAKMPRQLPAGFALEADATIVISPGARDTVSTGIALAIPGGMVAKIHGRRALASKGITIHDDIVDASFRGELRVVVTNNGDLPFRVKPGSCIATLFLEPSAPSSFIELSVSSVLAQVPQPRDRTAWQLNPEVFETINRLWGPHSVDLFSGPHNGLLRRRFTKDPRDTEAAAVDAFLQPWSKENGWANPPFDEETFKRIIDKVITEQATMTVVAPLWRRAPWYRDLIALSVACPRLLPNRPDLFRPGPDYTHGVGPPPEWLETAAFRISGRVTVREEFYQKLRKESFPPTVRMAGAFPNGHRLPFFHPHSGKPVRFDARANGSTELTPAEAARNSAAAPISAGTISADASSVLLSELTTISPAARIPADTPLGEVSSSSSPSTRVAAGDAVDNDQDYEVCPIQHQPRRKAYGLVEAHGRQVACLFDSASHADIMSAAFYNRFCRRIPLTPAQGYLQGFNGSKSVPRGRVTIRMTIGHRRVRITFLVLDQALDDLLIGEPLMHALGIDILNSQGALRIRGQKAKDSPALFPMLPSAAATPHSAGPQRQRKLCAMDDIVLPPHTAVYLDAQVPQGVTGDLYVDSLPCSSAIYVMKGFTSARDRLALVNVANLSDKPRRIHKGQAFGTYAPLDPEEACSSLDFIYDSYGDPAESSAPPFTKPSSFTNLGAVSSVATYAAVKAKTTDEKPSAAAISDMPARRPTVNWADIPGNLQIGRGADSVTDDQLNGLTDLLREMNLKGAFSSASNPGQVRPEIAVHHIDTGDARPRAFPPRRMAPAKRTLVEKETANMLASGVIRPSRSPWAAPVVIAPKKDGGIRFCVDYRELNTVTRKDVYPLPRIDDTVDALNGARFLSAFDMLSGYWQVPVAPGDAAKTAFVTHQGLYEWTCMPFGLTGAPATFQRMMDTVLAGLKWQCCLVYLDDVVVFSRTFDEHIRDLRIVFDRLLEAGLKLKPSKCFFCCTELLYLGYLLTPEGLKPDPTTKRAILDFPTPRDLSAVRTFLGMTGHYRQFIEKYALIAAPLVQLTKKDIGWRWSDEQQQAFERLKELLITPPILKLPDFTRKFSFTLQTDASDQGLGAVLAQKGEDGHLHPVAYASRRLTKDELKYHTQEKEALAIIWACEKFRSYLMGETFDVETDHGSLKWLLGTQKGRLARWAMRLSDFDLTIKPKPGKANGNADAPSRYPVEDADPSWSPDTSMPYYTDVYDTPPTDSVSAVDSVGSQILCNLTTSHAVNAVHVSSTSDLLSGLNLSEYLPADPEPPAVLTDTLRQRLITAQRKDRSTSAVLHFLRKEVPTLELPEGGKVYYPDHLVSKMRVATDGLIEINTPHYVPGLPIRKARKRAGIRPKHQDVSQILMIWRAVVPTSMRADVLSLAHKSPLAGHLGRNKVYSTLLPHFFWKGLSGDVKDFIRACDVCQRFKRAPRPWLRPLRPITEEEPFGAVAIDLITDLPETAGGKYRYLAVFTDMFTKWPEACPMAGKTALDVADAFFRKIICQHGVPKRIQTDQGPEFVNDVIARLADRMRITHVTTTPYNPSSNGAAEQFNKTLVASLRSYCLHENSMNWDRFLDGVLYAYRVSPHASAKFSPFQLVYGRQPRLPWAVMEPDDVEFTKDIESYNTRHTYELHRAFQCVRAALRDARDAYKDYHDRNQPRNATAAPFVLGDEVMLYSPRLITPGEIHPTAVKLQARWNGPFNVVEISKTGDVITIRDASRILRVKVADLKRFYRPPVLHDASTTPGVAEPTATGPAAQEPFALHSEASNRPAASATLSPLHSPSLSTAPSHMEEENTLHATQAVSPVPLPDKGLRDPNRSYAVDYVRHHTRRGNRILYMVRWEPPFADPSHDCFIAEGAFDRPSNRRMPPALERYWQAFPPKDRPVAFRQLPCVPSGDTTTAKTSQRRKREPTSHRSVKRSRLMTT